MNGFADRQVKTNTLILGVRKRIVSSGVILLLDGRIRVDDGQSVDKGRPLWKNVLSHEGCVTEIKEDM